MQRCVPTTLLGSLLGLLITTAGAGGQQPQAPSPVSLVQLIANPEKYDGKVVFGVGFIDLTRENTLLYLGRADFDQAILTNAIWLEPSQEMMRNRENLDLNYVKFVGTFRAGRGKHSYYQSGGITDVQSCVPWPDREHTLKPGSGDTKKK